MLTLAKGSYRSDSIRTGVAFEGHRDWDSSDLSFSLSLSLSLKRACAAQPSYHIRINLFFLCSVPNCLSCVRACPRDTLFASRQNDPPLSRYYTFPLALSLTLLLLYFISIRHCSSRSLSLSLSLLVIYYLSLRHRSSSTHSFSW